MTETNKTFTFIAVALAACLAAYISQPGSAEYDAGVEVGGVIADPFPTEVAKRMKITRFDEDSAELKRFEVAQVGRLWSIPSKGGYPADAEDQMAKAVDGVRDREIRSVASKSQADHELYGVVDPESPKLSVGQTGVGTRVTLLDESDKELVDLIIGEEVKDAEGQHYVRRADQHIVYVTDINPDDFSTTFEDWIEDDLLKISPWDIQQVRLNDYTAELFMTQQGGLGVDTDYRCDLTLRYNDSDSKWAPVSLKQATDPKRGVYEAFELAEDEELDEDKLSELKNALDDLRIVDIAKKPAGLSANLKAGEDFLNDNESLGSLIIRGFAPVGTAAGGADLLSSSGEVVCAMKDGVEYVLRFGNPQVTTSGEEKPEQKEEGAAEGDNGGQSAVNRYLFVMARFNEASIESPELEIVPELPEGVTADEADEEETDDSREVKADDDAADEEPQEEDTEESSADEEESKDLATEELIAERKAVEQRNQRKLDEYADKIKQGKEKVDALNERFGDWYYVIANDVFKKMHLGRDDVIKKKELGEGEEDAATPNAGPLGALGSPIPGMPDLSGFETSEPVEEASEEEAANEGPSEEAEADASETEAIEENGSEEEAADNDAGE